MADTKEIIYDCADCGGQGKIVAGLDGQIAVIPCECVKAVL